MTIPAISFYGFVTFTAWCCLLTSEVTAIIYQAPIKSLEDLKEQTSDYQLVRNP